MERIVRLLIGATILFAAISGCSSIPRADVRSSRPLSVSLDVAPGYGNALYLPVPDGPLDLVVVRAQASPTKKWGPTFFLSYYSEKRDVSYYLYIFEDLALKKMRAQTRLYEGTKSDPISTKTYAQAYDLNHRFRVRSVLTAKKVTFYVDEQLIGTQQLLDEPKFVELGGSSGTFNISLISPPPPPAPE